jgi:hypothetical protein
MVKKVLDTLGAMGDYSSMYYDMVRYSGLRVLPDDRRKSDPCYIKRTPDSEWELLEDKGFKCEYKEGIVSMKQLGADIRELGVSKNSFKIIAERYGLTYETVHHKLNDMGYTEAWQKAQTQGVKPKKTKRQGNRCEGRKRLSKYER